MMPSMFLGDVYISDMFLFVFGATYSYSNYFEVNRDILYSWAILIMEQHYFRKKRHTTIKSQ